MLTRLTAGLTTPKHMCSMLEDACYMKETGSYLFSGNAQAKRRLAAWNKRLIMSL